VAIFALTLLLMAGFLALMLWPFMKSMATETRRVAELLSNLPPEVSHALDCCTIGRANPDGNASR
jgi:hypothetical protein